MTPCTMRRRLPGRRPSSAKRWSAEAWHRAGAGGAWVELRGRLDRTRGWWLPRVDAVERDRIPFPAGPVVLATAASGDLGWLAATYGWVRGPLSGSGSHTVRGVLSGDDALERAHAALPRHRSVHRVRWRPLPDVALGARLEARSGARWADFATAGPLFDGTLAGGAWLDLSAEKALLAGRGAVEVRVLDVLDREMRLHPLAGTPGLTLEVLGRLRLGAQSSGPGASSESLRR